MADCQQACVSAPAKRKRLTSAEKMRNLRARRKLLDPNFQQKENLRLKAVKANTVNAMTNLELAEYKKKNRDRKRKSRLLKANAEKPPTTATSTPTTSYRSPQSYGRAVRKAERALPSSPRKRKVVVWGVAKRIGESLATKAENNLRTHGNGLSEDTVRTVQDFF